MINSINDKVALNGGGEIPAVGFGVWDPSFSEDTKAQVLTALDVGYRHIDAASFYKNEPAVGEALSETDVPREDIFLTTKIWISQFEEVKKTLDNSLRDLHTDYIDLYLLHWPGTDENLMLHAWEDLIRMREKGKVKAIGASNFLHPHIDSVEKHTGVPLACDQLELHPWHRQPETVDYCRSRGIPITAWGPIFHGHLSEEPLVAEIGKAYGKSAAQVTLRWHIQREHVIIPKSKSRERMIENISLFDFTLTGEDMARIDALDGTKQLGDDPMTFNG